jgi:positive regulator of sigma E activity
MKIQSSIHFVLIKYQQMKRHMITISKCIAMQLSNKMKVDLKKKKLLKSSMINYVLSVSSNKFMFICHYMYINILTKKTNYYYYC